MGLISYSNLTTFSYTRCMKKILLLIFISLLSIISQEVFPFDGLDDETVETEIYKGSVESFQIEV